MKKQVKTTLLVLLAAVSFLPACGKSKNAATTTTASVPGFNYGYTGVGTAASSFAVAGSVSFNGSGWMYGSLTSSGNTALPSGNQYTHMSVAGDQVNLVLSGTSAYAVIYLTQSSVAYFQSACGGAVPTTMTFNGTALNSPRAGQFQGFIRIVASNGCQLAI